MNSTNVDVFLISIFGFGYTVEDIKLTTNYTYICANNFRKEFYLPRKEFRTL